MYKREDFEIGINNWGDRLQNWFYVSKINGRGYLWKDGTINGDVNYLDSNSVFKNALGYYKSKQEAEQTLTEFLRRQNMNEVEARIAQCQVDIETLQKELKNLEKQKEEKKFYLGERFTVGDTTYMLAKVSSIPDRAALIVILSKDRRSIGNTWKHGTVDFYYENGKYFTTKLPTMYPQDFGIDNKYSSDW